VKSNSPPPIPQWPPIVDVLNVAVDDALHERKSVDAALRWAVEAAKGIRKGTA